MSTYIKAFDLSGDPSEAFCKAMSLMGNLTPSMEPALLYENGATPPQSQNPFELFKTALKRIETTHPTYRKKEHNWDPNRYRMGCAVIRNISPAPYLPWHYSRIEDLSNAPEFRAQTQVCNLCLFSPEGALKSPEDQPDKLYSTVCPTAHSGAGGYSAHYSVILPNPLERHLILDHDYVPEGLDGLATRVLEYMKEINLSLNPREPRQAGLNFCPTTLLNPPTNLPEALIQLHPEFSDLAKGEEAVFFENRHSTLESAVTPARKKAKPSQT